MRLIDRVDLRQVGELIPNLRIARKHTSQRIRQIAASMCEPACVDPIPADENDVLIARHGRLERVMTSAISTASLVQVDGQCERVNRKLMLAHFKVPADIEDSSDVPVRSCRTPDGAACTKPSRSKG